MMARILALLLLACMGRSWAVELGPEVPRWNPDADPAGERPEPPLVSLPGSHPDALRLLHAWNAIVPSLPGPPPGAPGLTVPSLIALYGAEGKAGADPESDAEIQSWGLIQPGGYGRLPAASARAWRFPIYHWPEAGIHVLPVPSELHRRRIQGFVDGQWQAAGHPPPRPVFAAERELSTLGALRTIAGQSGLARLGWPHYVMLGIGLLLLYLGIARRFEPLLLVPIAVGCIFVNAVGAGMAEPATGTSAGGILWFFTEFGIATGIFPLLIFLGVGALTDFGPLLANPWMALLGGAAQFGIFGAFFLATLFGFPLSDAAAIAIIGGGDGPTSIYVAAMLAPDKLGAIAVAAYSYMALVPIIQPPVMRALTTRREREIMMVQARPVSQRARILFPIAVIAVCLLLLPAAVPLIGMLMFGNLLRESGVTDRLSKTAQNELINLVTIALGLAVGTKLAAEQFLSVETLGILVLGCIAFVIGTASGVLFGKLMCLLSRGRVNPLIGAAGVSAVPMSARVVQTVGARADPRNILLMHAMGPNVAGVIGSAVAAGILLALLGA